MEAQLADFSSRDDIGGHLLTIQQLRIELEATRVEEQQREKEVEELKERLAASEVEKVAIRVDLDSMKEKFKWEIERRNVAACRERRLACRSLACVYGVVLEVVRANLQKRKEEKDAEIHLQEVRIEALTEYNEGGFELEEEVERLKHHETSLEIDYGLAAVYDTSLRRLDLHQVSDDSINQDRAED
ncbi:Uncharacterized protein Rs2_21557 [Raphanus sativus]|nr:Uncharacterized protein Rs2_21557 [Raphanus sativus]